MITDQQFVAHLYFALDDADGDAVRQSVREIMDGCGTALGMTERVLGLPLSPETFTRRLSNDGATALAARERLDGSGQVVVRTLGDVLHLSVALSPDRSGGDGGWHWWRTLDLRWHEVVAGQLPRSLGEARIYLATAREPLSADELTRLLPAGVGGPFGQPVELPGSLVLREIALEPEERVQRRFTLSLPLSAEAAAAVLVWSRGSTEASVLARYLMHAAQLRRRLREWRGDARAREFHGALDRLESEMHRLGAGSGAAADLQRLRGLDAPMSHTELEPLRRWVEKTVSELRRSRELCGLSWPAGFFATDVDLAQSFLARLDDELAGSRIAAGWPEPVAADPHHRPPPVPSRSPVSEAEYTRNVFVVHGRDEKARKATFALLRAIGLNPLEWEGMVKMAGLGAAPQLGEVVAKVLPLAKAAVVLMTPDDVVHLHPELHGPMETVAETRPHLQARPNVLLEMGMALAFHRERTLILMVGSHRPISDLGGLNYVQVTEGPQFRKRVASRLREAGCAVNDSGEDWLDAGDFESLTAIKRRASE